MGIIWGSYGNITDISDKWIHQWHQMMSEGAIQCEFMIVHGDWTNNKCWLWCVFSRDPAISGCFSSVFFACCFCWGGTCFFFWVLVVTSKNTTMSVELNRPVEWNVPGFLAAFSLRRAGAIWGLPEVLRRGPCGRWKLDHCRAWSDGEALGWEE